MGITLNPSEDFTLEVRTNLGTSGIIGSGAATQVAFWTDPSTLSGDANFVWDSGNKRVGIGTGSPSYPFHVTASAGTTGADSTAAFAFMTGSSADAAVSRFAFQSRVTLSHTSGTIAAGLGSVSDITASGSGGTTTGAYGFVSTLTASAGAIVTTRYGLTIWNASGAGTVGTQYGVYVDNLAKGATNYGIYTSGTTPSYFGGKVGIKSTTAGKELEIRGELVVAQAGVAGGALVAPTANGAAISVNSGYDSTNPTAGWGQVLAMSPSGIAVTGNIYSVSNGSITSNRPANWSSNGAYWGSMIQDVGGAAGIMIGESGPSYTTGGGSPWIGNSNHFVYWPGSDLRFGISSATIPLVTMNTTGVAINTAGSAQYIFTTSTNATGPRIHTAGTVAQFLAADSTATRVLVDSYGAIPTLVTRHAANTNASPTASTSGVIGAVAGYGYGATGYSPAARAQLQFAATETWTDAAQGSRAIIQTTATGGTTTADKLIVENDGQLTNALVTLSGKNPGVFFVQTSDSTTTANSLTTLLGTGQGTLTLPANFLTVGRTITLRVFGYTSTQDGAGYTKTLTATLGGTTIATGTTGAAFQAATNTGWQAELIITCRTTGASGSVHAQGCIWQQIVSAAQNVTRAVATATTTINTTNSQVINLTFNNGGATGVLTTTNAIATWNY